MSMHPDDVESYIQEKGRGGRDGNLLPDMIYYFKIWTIIKHVDMESKCVFCDICLKTCACDLCMKITVPFFYFF